MQAVQATYQLKPSSKWLRTMIQKGKGQSKSSPSVTSMGKEKRLYDSSPCGGYKQITISQIISYSKNQEIYLRHGWFVVRNRTPSEVEEAIGPSVHCSREQEFFNRDPWNQLPEERRGTEALKNYLAELLCDRIEKVFPKILHDIETRRNGTALELEALGLARTSIEQKLLNARRTIGGINCLIDSTVDIRSYL